MSSILEKRDEVGEQTCFVCDDGEITWWQCFLLVVVDDCCLCVTRVVDEAADERGE